MCTIYPGNPNLIYFSNISVLRTTNYYVQQLFATNQGDSHYPGVIATTAACMPLGRCLMVLSGKREISSKASWPLSFCQHHEVAAAFLCVHRDRRGIFLPATRAGCELGLAQQHSLGAAQLYFHRQGNRALDLKEKIGVKSTVGLLKYGLTRKLIVV